LILIIKLLPAIQRLTGCVMLLKSIVNFVVLLLPVNHPVDWARDVSSPRLKEDQEEHAGSEEIPLNCEESVNLYIAAKCFIILCAINKQCLLYKNIICYIWGERTSVDYEYILKMFCIFP